jgi:gluconate 2-dehydrogenase gamma chain
MNAGPMTENESIALTFFNDFEARTIEAIAERIIPGGDGEVGATDAGVIYYIDKAVAGFSLPLQKVYRLGLRALERECRVRYSASFVDLDATRQDETVRRFLGPEVVRESDAVAAEKDHDLEGPRSSGLPTEAPIERAVIDRFFAVVREHAIEGMFCDPVYGGNRNMTGWRLVGFPGVHWGYTEEQMKEGYDGRQLPVRSLSDLRRDLKARPKKASPEKIDRQ